jgi:hypothetical protein
VTCEKPLLSSSSVAHTGRAVPFFFSFLIGQYVGGFGARARARDYCATLLCRGLHGTLHARGRRCDRCDQRDQQMRRFRQK